MTATLLAGLALVACAGSIPPEPTSAAEAIRAVLEEDSRLGGVRNHAPESMPLAEAVGDYVRSLDEIDFGECPADFTAAFRRHRDAWQESIAYLEEYPELRGEIHDLFDDIRAVSADAKMRIESIEKGIWGTWAEVEAALERHGGE